MTETDFTVTCLIAVRTYIMQITNVTVVTLLMHECLQKRNSYKFLVIWQGLRCLLINAVFSVVLEEVRMANPSLQNFYAIIYSLATFVTIAAYIYTFKDVAKTLCLFFVLEFPVVLLSYGIIAIVGLLEQHSIYVMHPFEIMDLLIPIIEFSVTALIIRWARPWFQKFRAYELRHPKVWCMISVAYVMPSAAMTVMTNYSMQFSKNLQWAIVTLALLLGYLIAEFFFTWQRQVRFQNDYLKRQKELQSIHYEAIQRQIWLMQRGQQEIDLQMKTIMEMNEEEQTDERIIAYLRSLKKKRDEIEAGIYCNDWIVDGILCYYAKECKSSGIETDFQMQKYDRGNMKDEDISEILLILFDKIINDLKHDEEVQKKIVFSMSRVRNFMVVKIEYTRRKNKLALRKYPKKYLGKYNGDFLMEGNRKNGVQIEATFQVE